MNLVACDRQRMQGWYFDYRSTLSLKIAKLKSSTICSLNSNVNPSTSAKPWETKTFAFLSPDNALWQYPYKMYPLQAFKGELQSKFKEKKIFGYKYLAFFYYFYTRCRVTSTKDYKSVLRIYIKFIYKNGLKF